jgi:hypothetical protein
VFTARYGLIPYTKQIMVSVYKVKLLELQPRRPCHNMYFSTEVWAAQRTDENVCRIKAQTVKRQRNFTDESIRRM